MPSSEAVDAGPGKCHAPWGTKLQGGVSVPRGSFFVFTYLKTVTSLLNIVISSSDCHVQHMCCCVHSLKLRI